MRNFSMKNMIWKNRGHEFDTIANDIFSENVSYCIYGEKSKELYEKIAITEWGKGKNIIIADRMEDIVFGASTVVICTFWNRKRYEETVEYLTQVGFEENRNLFQGEVFSMLYDVYIRNEIKIDRIEIFLTSCCTLNCEKCIAYIPYFDKPKVMPLQSLKDDADLLFSKVDYVYKMKLLGGEVLLYPYLVEYVDYLYDNYRDKIGSIRIGSNGTIFPTQAVLEMCKRDKVTVDVSDYTLAVPNMCMLDEVKRICEEHEVLVDVKRTGEQWLDMGFPNDIPEKKNEAQLREHFHKCAMFCRQFNNGKYYFCCSNFAAVYAGLFPDDENNYFDFKQNFTKKELMEYELGYSTLGHTTFCDVCKGCSEEVNQCSTPVAKQMVRGQ